MLKCTCNSLNSFRWCSTTWIVWCTTWIAMEYNYAPLAFKVKVIDGCGQISKQRMHYRHHEELCIVVVFVGWMNSIKLFVTMVTPVV